MLSIYICMLIYEYVFFLTVYVYIYNRAHAGECMLIYVLENIKNVNCQVRKNKRLDDYHEKKTTEYGHRFA